MLRLRLFRLLLPALLVLLGVGVAYNLKPRDRVHSEELAAPAETEAKGLTFTELVGEVTTVVGNAQRVLESADGTLELEGIEDFRITRPGRPPLVINAEHGAGVGPEAERRWRFEDGVEFYDPDSEMRLTLPELHLDQQAGEARAEGDIRFAAPGMQGTVQGLVYGLRGQPSSLRAPVLEDGTGGRLVADTATLWDGFDDLELVGHVRAERPAGWIEAERMRLHRDEEGRLRRVDGQSAVRGRWQLATLLGGDLAADELGVEWDAQGRVASARLHGNAILRRGVDEISAPTIEASLAEKGSGWDVRAFEAVTVRGLFPGGTGLLLAQRLDAELDALAHLTRATAVGRVSFEGPSMRAEGERGEYETAPAGGKLRLYGHERHKARFAHADIRVAADTITTDMDFVDLLAQGAVEATLLPAADSQRDAARVGLFRAGDAVHFVAERLRSTGQGARHEFVGAVRGWQGENNLAASRISLTREPNALAAEGEVSSRFPRDSAGTTVGEADFVLISSDRLDYDEGESRAIYEGNVRMRFAEGALTSRRLEVQLDAGSRAIVEARASGDVTFEAHASADGELDAPITGRADRLVYQPSEAVVRLHGDASPAEIHRQNEAYAGRVLIYRLEDGTTELDAGSHGPATITNSPSEGRATEPK